MIKRRQRADAATAVPARIACPLRRAGDDVMVAQLGPIRGVVCRRITARHRLRPSRCPGTGTQRSQLRIALQRRRAMGIVVNHQLHGLLMVERSKQPLEVPRTVERLDPEVAAVDADHLVGHADQPLDVAYLGLFRKLEDGHIPSLELDPATRAEKRQRKPVFHDVNAIAREARRIGDRCTRSGNSRTSPTTTRRPVLPPCPAGSTSRSALTV